MLRPKNTCSNTEVQEIAEQRRQHQLLSHAIVTTQDEGWRRKLGMSWVTQNSSNISESCHCCQCSSWEWETGDTWHGCLTATCNTWYQERNKNLCMAQQSKLVCPKLSVKKVHAKDSAAVLFAVCTVVCYMALSESQDFYLLSGTKIPIMFPMNFCLWMEKNWSVEDSHTAPSRDICIVSKSYADILAEHCVWAMQAVPQSHWWWLKELHLTDSLEVCRLFWLPRIK